jgi:threonyl-tRNA synthetase
VDFNLPHKFDVTYVGEDGKEQPVAMIHRTVLGSMERFMASITEHYGGAFPVWLAPFQVMLIPIADRHLEYAQSLADQLNKDSIRVEVDSRQETVNQKIRQAQLGKVPYMLVVGDREVAAGTVAVRRRDGSQRAEPFTEFRRNLKKKIRTRSLED